MRSQYSRSNDFEHGLEPEWFQRGWREALKTIAPAMIKFSRAEMPTQIEIASRRAASQLRGL